MLQIFISDSKLRPFWRAVLFLVIGIYVLPIALDPLFAWLNSVFHTAPLSPLETFIDESELLVIALITTGIFAWYEGRRIWDYGLPLGQAFRGRFWEGFAIGVAGAALVAGGMMALHGMVIQGIALTGSQLIIAALAWLAANLMVGFAEELWFRGYLLQTLWKSLGFWPAAILIALFFAAEHFFFKQGENVWDVITLVSLSIWVCITVLRTGTLWLAVGFHAAFDYMQLFVIGTKNGNIVPVDHLLNVSFPGPAWVTGGVLGTEASLLMYPVIALMYVYVLWRTRDVNAQATTRLTSLPGT